MKFGSLQQFVENKGPVENFSCSNFHKDEVHKIAILDLRILNLDRNDTNILVKIKQKIEIKDGKKVKRPCYSLVPIDHGLSIPDRLAVQTYDLTWLSWE